MWSTLFFIIILCVCVKHFINCKLVYKKKSIINTNRCSLWFLKDEVTNNSFNESTHTSLSNTDKPLSEKQLELN